MRKSRFIDEQIIGFLKQAEGGRAVAELCRRHGFSDWRKDHNEQLWMDPAGTVRRDTAAAEQRAKPRQHTPTVAVTFNPGLCYLCGVRRLGAGHYHFTAFADA